MDPGRTVGLIARIQHIVGDAIAAGNHFSVAADAAGISKSTLEKWRRRGARGEQPFADFVKAIHQAELDWEVSAVKAIQSAGEKDWRAHLELLSRRIPSAGPEPTAK